MIAHLLASPPTSTPFGSDGLLVASHIRSLKDLHTLSLTPNPTLLTQTVLEFESSSNIGTQENQPTAAFVCPISLREMNGTVKFVYRKPCGCVMSESALREMRKAAGGAGTTVCPVTGEEDVEEEWVTINPMGDEKECATEAWAALCAWERDEKKAAKELKKRKSGGGADDPPREKKAKVAKLHPAVAPSIGTAGATVPKLSATLADKIAEQ